MHCKVYFIKYFLPYLFAECCAILEGMIIIMMITYKCLFMPVAQLCEDLRAASFPDFENVPWGGKEEHTSLLNVAHHKISVE